MRTFTLPDARPGAHAMIRSLDGGADLGVWLNDGPVGAAKALAPGATLMCWPGESPDVGLERGPLTWMPEARSGFEAQCEALLSAATAADGRVLFRPHARRVLSDPPSCYSFLEDRADAPVGVALDPASMLEPEMLASHEVHLTRAFELLGGRCEAVILSDASITDDGRVRPRPLGQGGLDIAVLAALTSQWIPEATPLILLEAAVSDQASLLERHGVRL